MPSTLAPVALIRAFLRVMRFAAVVATGAARRIAGGAQPRRAARSRVRAAAASVAGAGIFSVAQTQ